MSLFVQKQMLGLFKCQQIVILEDWYIGTFRLHILQHLLTNSYRRGDALYLLQIDFAVSFGN